MGNASARAQPVYQLDSVSQYRTYLLEYSNQTGNLVFVDLVGDGKFIKSVHGLCDGNPVIVKIYRLYDPSENLSSADAEVDKLKSKCSITKHPNIIPYFDWQLSPKSNIAFLMRQYLGSSLNDRFHTRPFLTTIEKKWISFQLLKALEQIHGDQLCHGDIKAENIMVTSWNWILLTDFAPFKPTYLPEDDPADYYYYFTGSSRRCCNLAPERLYNSSKVGADAIFLSNLADSQLSAETVDKQAEMFGKGNRKDGILRESMDIFSMGCVIGEIFMGGKPVFDLPSLLKYRSTSGKAEVAELDNRLRPMALEVKLDSIDLTKVEPDAQVQQGVPYPQFAKGFFHWIHSGKNKTESFSKFDGKKRVYLVVNGFGNQNARR